MELNIEKVREIMPSISDGLIKYISIMEKLYVVDVSKDTVFQKEFNHFYRMRQRPRIYYDYFF